MPATSPAIATDIVVRIRAEYLEMPGLRLTVEQIMRLCGLERDACARVLDALVRAKFLCVKSDGSYARLTDGELASPALARARTPQDRSSQPS